MKFKKILKRQVYETWFNKNRKYGLTSQIYKAPDYYHFSVSCNLRRCKRNICEKCDLRIQYSSLDNQDVFNTFEKCVEAIEFWYRTFLR